MATPLGGREPLERFLGVNRQTESELAVQLRYAAEEIGRLLAGTDLGVVRRAQYAATLREVRSVMDGMLNVGVLDAVETGKRRAVDAAADSALATLGEYATVDGVPMLNRESLRATARNGIENVVSRSTNNVTLAQRVYNTSVASGQAVQRLIDNGILSGQSAREIARSARSFIEPGTPGGVSYAAMRLGRTELNNAFHSTQIKLVGTNPFVESMDWNLSRSHPKTDRCDELKAGGPYPADKVPGKPHPQCFCFITPNVEDEDEFVQKFADGKYDDYLDQQIAAAGQYQNTEQVRALALTQRRVTLKGNRQVTINSLTKAQLRTFTTAEERRLLKTFGYVS